MGEDRSRSLEVEVLSSDPFLREKVAGILEGTAYLMISVAAIGFTFEALGTIHKAYLAAEHLVNLTYHLTLGGI